VERKVSASPRKTRTRRRGRQRPVPEHERSSLYTGTPRVPHPVPPSGPCLCTEHSHEPRSHLAPRPPAAATTLAARRGPPWLVTIFDFLERQLSLATNVEDRIALLRAYTCAALAIFTLLLGAGAAGMWFLAHAHTPSLVMLAAGGVATGLGASIRRLGRYPQRAPRPPQSDSPSVR
jgi:hypothetical protein